MGKSCSDVTGRDMDQADARVWRERVLTPEDLFHGTDEAGRTGWFLRLSMTGMYPRRLGPYDSQEEALDVLEYVAYQFVVETMTDILGDLEANQVCIQEGVAPLAPTAPACV